MTKYSAITILYNPISTGPGKTIAKELQADLRRLMPENPVKLIATQYVRHAEELAYNLAQTSSRPLIISASGDGGYNEVVNGLIKAQKEGANPVAGLLPAGNANDHFNDLHEQETVEAINANKTKKIDLLKLSAIINSQKFERYAHSYIGFGLTPKVGLKLNKTRLNRFNEIWLVLKTLFLISPTRLVVDGKKQAYDSLIFSNIAKMSKVLSLPNGASNDDGKFEVTAVRKRSRLALLASLLRATITGLPALDQTDQFKLSTVKPTLVQLDGEVFTLDAGCKVYITIERQILSCII